MAAFFMVLLNGRHFENDGGLILEARGFIGA
jgi:hypothetical protein